MTRIHYGLLLLTWFFKIERAQAGHKDCTPQKIDAFYGLEAQDLFLCFQVMSIRVNVPSTGLIHHLHRRRRHLSLLKTPNECFAVSCWEFGLGTQHLKRFLKKNWKHGKNLDPQPKFTLCTTKLYVF